MASKRTARRQAERKSKRQSIAHQNLPQTTTPAISPELAVVSPTGWTTHWRRWSRVPSISLPAWPAQPIWAERIVGADAASWRSIVLVLPILVLGLSLTTGWTMNGFLWIDNDYWWHLGTGNWILDQMEVPRTDPFSWTYDGEDWVAHEWLAEVILALVVRAGGYAGAIVFTAALAIIGYWWLVSATRIYGLSWRAIAILTLVCGGVFLRPGVLVTRPQVWTFALLALLLAHLAGYDTGRRRTLWLVPLLFVIWVNLNLTALIGIACLGAFGLDHLVRRRLDRHLVTIGLLSLAALFVNPTGPGLIEAALKYRGQNEIWHQHIFEWMSPELSDPTHRGFLLALPVIPLAVWQLFRLRIWPALPLLILGYQSFGAIRFIPVFVILVWFFVSWLVWQVRQEESPTLASLFPIEYRHPWTFAPPMIAMLLVLVVASRSDYSQLRRDPVAIGYPVEATTILLAGCPDPDTGVRRCPSVRLFNVYDYGGYLIYRFDGEPGVYVDGRGEMYSNDFLRLYFDLIAGKDGWDDVFEQIGVNAVLVRHGLVTDQLSLRIENDPAWQLIYENGVSNLYIRVPVVEGDMPPGEQIGG